MTQAENSAAVTSSNLARTGMPGVMFTPERIQELLERLSEPFDPEVVEWRVTVTSSNRKRGQVAPYADQRAYTDRLNELFTAAGWTREYSVQTVQNFEVPGRDGKNGIITAKVMVTSKVTIHGIGTHSGTGEEWAMDPNALTRAEAQAFKRACSCFGLGRYFYDMPETWVDLDENKRPLRLPVLPDWALPKKARGTARESKDAGASSRRSASKNRNLNSDHSRRSNASDWTPAGRAQHDPPNGRSNGLLGQELRRTLDKLAGEVGFGLTQWVVREVAKKDDLASVNNNAHLTSILEKLTDLARGVQRLLAATEKAGSDVYARLCKELDLPSDSIDDIPNRKVLEVLVGRMESAAVQTHSNAVAGAATPGTNGATGPGANGSSSAPANGNRGTIKELRERLLIEARRISSLQRKGIGDVIAAASKGSFTFAELTKLGDSDAGKIEAALEELARMTG